MNPDASNANPYDPRGECAVGAYSPPPYSFARFLLLVSVLLVARWLFFVGSIAMPDSPWFPELEACDYMQETPARRAECDVATYAHAFLNIILLAAFTMPGAKLVLQEVTPKYIIGAGMPRLALYCVFGLRSKVL